MAASVPIPGATSARNDRSDVLATLPLVVLVAVLVWLAFVRGAFEENVAGSRQTNTHATVSPSVALRFQPSHWFQPSHSCVWKLSL